MPEKISILKETGETISSNIVSVFFVPSNEKKYIITTENAVDPHGLTVLHVSEIVDGSLQRVATEEEWSTIKSIMRAMISGNVSSYQYLSVIDTINASGQYSRDISVSASAYKQMVDNYAAADKSNSLGGNNTQPNMGSSETLGNESFKPSTIFPTNGNGNVNSDDEVIPGISMVNEENPSNNMNNINNMNKGNNSSSQIPNPVGIETPNNSFMEQRKAEVNDPQVNTMNQNFGGMSNGFARLDNTMPQPVIQNNGMNNMNNDVQMFNQNQDNKQPEVVQPLTNNVNTMTANNLQVNNNLIDANDSLSNVGVQNESLNQVQQPVPFQEHPPVQPTVQPVMQTPKEPVQESIEETVVPSVEATSDDRAIDFNANPSFKPDATLDEVVVAAEAMFMEGVKNLVKSIEEKLYREIYTKDAELKEKEKVLAEREKMLNGQMMAMMSNFAMMQGNAMNPMMKQQMMGNQVNNGNKA